MAYFPQERSKDPKAALLQQGQDRALARVLVADLEKALQDSQEEVVRLQAMVAQAKVLLRQLEAKAALKAAPQFHQDPREKKAEGWHH
jgi:hypothetical protein